MPDTGSVIMPNQPSMSDAESAPPISSPNNRHECTELSSSPQPSAPATSEPLSASKSGNRPKAKVSPSASSISLRIMTRPWRRGCRE